MTTGHSGPVSYWPPTPDRSQVLREGRVGSDGALYVLGYKAQRLTLYAQQVRALNLIWALEKTGQLSAKSRVVVVGGGVAGLTAAAAAGIRDAEVWLLEQRNALVPLQQGCSTRYLHPHVFDWPDLLSRRAAAHVPLLEWTVGSADEVAGQLVDRFLKIRQLAGGRIHEPELGATEVTIQSGGTGDHYGVTWKANAERRALDKVDVVVIAAGFGIERGVPGLPTHSYWRLDDLSQEVIAECEGPYRLLVAGTGDGGCIDLIRGALRSFDHGPFLDECISTLEPAKEEFGSFEETLGKHCEQIARAPDVDLDNESSSFLAQEYAKLESRIAPTVEAIDKLISRHRRPETCVKWLGRTPTPLSHRARPLNRLLAWRLVEKEIVTYSQGSLVRVLPQPNAGPARHIAELADGTTPAFDRIVVRYGVNPPALVREMEKHGRIQAASDIREISAEVFDHFRAPYVRLSSRDKLPKILASVVHSYPPKQTSAGAFSCYRIDLQVTGAETAYVDYELHPEFGMVRKRSTSADEFRTWVLAYDDFWVRVRTRGGVEVGCWLTEAIRAKGELTRLEEQAVRDLRKVAGHLTGSRCLPTWAEDPPQVRRGRWNGNSRIKRATLADELNRPYGPITR